MGNINYNNFMCENYYCQSVSYKPEWFSENSWNIDYNLKNNNMHIDKNSAELREMYEKIIRHKNPLELEKEYEKIISNINKPFTLNKGVLKISNTMTNDHIIPLNIDLILSKQLLINEVKNFFVPLNFKYYLANELNIYIIFSTNLLTLKNLNLESNLDNVFFIKLLLSNKNIIISRSINNNINTHKIKTTKNNIFNISIQYNTDYLLINEELIKNKNKNIIKIDNSIKMFDTLNNNLYLSIYIKNKNNLIENNQYIELNFE
jgi:hypothetical protein